MPKRSQRTPEELDLEIARKTLRDVAKNGKLEFAKVAAAKALAAIATGDKVDADSAGKKEKAVAAAKKLAAGKFSPRKPKLVVNNGMDHS